MIEMQQIYVHEFINKLSIDLPKISFLKIVWIIRTIQGSSIFL